MERETGGPCTLCKAEDHGEDHHYDKHVRRKLKQLYLFVERLQKSAETLVSERNAAQERAQALDQKCAENADSYDALLARCHELEDELAAAGVAVGHLNEFLEQHCRSIRDAAALFADGYRIDATADWRAFNERVEAWLSRPEVVKARER